MRGHVRRRGTTWTYVVDAGIGPSGKRTQKTKGGFTTKKAAQVALNEAINALREGVYVEPTRLTVGAFLTAHWLPAIRATVRPSTFSSYETHVRKYLVPALGNIGLQRLSPPAINAMYADLQLPRDGQRRLAPATVRRIHATLHRSLRDAVRWQLTARNAAASADPPRAPHPQTIVWNIDQLRAFLDFVTDDEMVALWLFYALTGVRRGEALGLRWTDIDLDAGTAAIRQTIIPVDHKLVFGEPKTDKGRRALALDQDTTEALRAHRRQQLHNRMLVGADYDDAGLVFARADGRPWHPELVSRRFARLVQRAGLPHIRLHDLRHTYATLSLTAGIGTRVVSERLGHSTLAVTADIYQHVPLSADAEAAARVANLVLHSPLQHGDDRVAT